MDRLQLYFTASHLDEDQCSDKLCQANMQIIRALEFRAHRHHQLAACPHNCPVSAASLSGVPVYLFPFSISLSGIIEF